MPIYEYRCDECAHQFEVIQKMSDDPLVECPACKESKLKKLISAAAFRLKGSGWYETDFKNNQNKPGKESGTAGSKSTTSAEASGSVGQNSGGEAAQSTASATSPNSGSTTSTTTDHSTKGKTKE